MVSFADFTAAAQADASVEFQCCAPINLYSSAELTGLATQAIAGRQLRIVSLPLDPVGNPLGNALPVCLCEDDYPGWLAWEDIDLLEVAESPYSAIVRSAEDIRARLPQVIAFAHHAMAQPNHYLWGGTTGPNFDCSGLMQTAFASVGIWLPRDSYQQAAFTRSALEETWLDSPPEHRLEAWFDPLEPGDLIFFGSPERVTHVGLYLGDRYYIHSSGKDQGRNGIGIDRLDPDGDRVSQAYYRQLKGAGRVLFSYQPGPR